MFCGKFIISNLLDRYNANVCFSREEAIVLYEKVEALLQERGVTAYQAAQEIGISPTVFYEWKSGKSCPKVDKMYLIARYFGVSIEHLIGMDSPQGGD